MQRIGLFDTDGDGLLDERLEQVGARLCGGDHAVDVAREKAVAIVMTASLRWRMPPRCRCFLLQWIMLSPWCMLLSGNLHAMPWTAPASRNQLQEPAVLVQIVLKLRVLVFEFGLYPGCLPGVLSNGVWRMS
eukprot:1488783-Rhodomonas_salina.3